MSETIVGLDKSTFRNYDFPLEKVPILHWENDMSDIVDLVKNKASLYFQKFLSGFISANKLIIQLKFSDLQI